MFCALDHVCHWKRFSVMISLQILELSTKVFMYSHKLLAFKKTLKMLLLLKH
jgi:hypothetical protein